MTLSQIRIIVYIAQVIACVVGIIGLTRWKQLSRPLQLLDIYILFDITLVIMQDVLAFHSIRNLWISHWFHVVELFLYSCIYILWYPGKRYSQLLWSAYGVYITVWIIGKFSFEPFYFADVYSVAISYVIQIGFGGWLLYAISQKHEFDLKKDPRFLVVSGVILYASAALFIQTMFNVMLNTIPRQTIRVILLSTSIFSMLQYIIFLEAFLCKPMSATVND